MPPRGKRFTIYDAMEDRGYFASNPANIDSRGPQNEVLYKGPVEYPKMLYDPKGHENIVIPASAEATPYGPQMMNEQRELRHRIVNSSEEESEARAEGWLSHPAHSIAAMNERLAAEGKALRVVPQATSGERIKQLEAEHAKMEQELEDMRKAFAAQQLTASRTSSAQAASAKR